MPCRGCNRLTVSAEAARGRGDVALADAAVIGIGGVCVRVLVALRLLVELGAMDGDDDDAVVLAGGVSNAPIGIACLLFSRNRLDDPVSDIDVNRFRASSCCALALPAIPKDRMVNEWESARE
jgi:hypothetical protein